MGQFEIWRVDAWQFVLTLSLHAKGLDMTAKTPKRPRDPNQLAKLVIDIASGERNDGQASGKSEMAILGRAGGLKGGKARAEKISPERRAEIARRAAEARWRDKD